ncbi:unnamed protein product [Adineta steineri]|uniref:Uncharacterized protein n=1 Tax=Adineta steineri TaxID=433720 RepID=A0A814BG33_9BILA|nr:unnamed protein product [Adineta steineri]CAF0928814.1 unnamed protein product [Adineta steineri]
MCTFNLYVGVLFFIVSKISGNDNITYPNFPRQAEFIRENIITQGQYKRVSSEFIFDSYNDRLIEINDENIIYSNYTILRKSIYPRNHLKQCNVYPIDVNNPPDGLSAWTNPDMGTTHIRPLNDIFNFPLNAIYLGETMLRGYIYVNQWISTISNDLEMIWSFSKSNYPMPWNPENFSIPVQIIKRQKSDGVILEVTNIFSYKTIITKTHLISPPSGIFCVNLTAADDLISLQDVGINFPERFSVRIDVSSTSQFLWHSVHLRYLSLNGQKFIRYDYTPFDNTQNPVTIILDNTDGVQRSYKIDRHTGSCIINDSVEIVLTSSVLHNPIETLIKYESLLLTNPPHHIFQYTGNRQCRGSILCSIFVAQLSGFPTDSQEDWTMTNIEWGWSKRNIDHNDSPYDYPVHLNLNLYRKNSEPPATIHYEFYDYHTEVHLNEFDVNLCYRSNQLWYNHLAFQLKITNQSTTDGIENVIINRRRLGEYIRNQMMGIMSLKYLRISQLELDHHPNEPGHNDTLYCIFTLLDRTPFVDPNSETEVLDAKNKLENAINSGEFHFTTDDKLSIEAIKNSLEDVRYFYVFNPNITSNQTISFSNTTVHVNRTIIETVEEVYEKIQYSDGAQAGAVIGGMIVGILIGLSLTFIVVFMIKKKANASPTGGLTFRNFNFRVSNNRTQDDLSSIAMENPIHSRNKTST